MWMDVKSLLSSVVNITTLFPLNPSIVRISPFILGLLLSSIIIIMYNFLLHI